MLSRMVLLVLAALLLTACGSTREFVDSPEGPTSAEVIESIQGKSVTVNLRDSSTYEGEAVQIAADTLALMLERGGTRKRVPLSSIKAVHVGRNPLAYVVGGILIGGAIGAYVGYETTKSEKSEKSEAPAPRKSGFDIEFGRMGPDIDLSGAIGAVLGGMIVAMIGGGAGYAVTPSTNYVFGENALMPDSGAVDRLTTIEVNSFTEEPDTYVSFNWADKKITLTRDALKIRRIGNLIRITAPKAVFQTAGTTID